MCLQIQKFGACSLTSNSTTSRWSPTKHTTQAIYRPSNDDHKEELINWDGCGLWTRLGRSKGESPGLARPFLCHGEHLSINMKILCGASPQETLQKQRIFWVTLKFFSSAFKADSNYSSGLSNMFNKVNLNALFVILSVSVRKYLLHLFALDQWLFFNRPFWTKLSPSGLQLLIWGPLATSPSSQSQVSQLFLPRPSVCNDHGPILFSC